MIHKNMISHPKKILLYLIVVFLIAIPIFHINAANEALDKAQGGLFKSASTDGAGLTSAEGNENDIRNIIGKIVGYILAMLGVLFLVQIIFAGYGWMISGGNEESIKKAKSKIMSSTIGLAIVLIAYVAVNAIFGLLFDVTQTL